MIRKVPVVAGFGINRIIGTVSQRRNGMFSRDFVLNTVGSRVIHRVSGRIDTQSRCAYILFLCGGVSRLGSTGRQREPQQHTVMAKSEFGEHLRRQREMRGVSLDEITASTRIGTRFLEAIESEQWDRLPGGIFNRGFVRAVARFLGLDEEDLIAEYEVATGESIGNHPAPDLDDRSASVRWNWTFALVVVLVIGITAGAWFGHRYRTRQAHNTVAQAQALDAQVAELGVPSSASMANAAPLDPRIALPNSAPSSSGGNPASAPPTGHLGEPAQLQLTISAGKPTSVQVIADGKSVFHSKMSAGENQRFEAQNGFIVWARDSSAVLLELNGQMVAPLGPVGRPGKVILTQKDLKKMAGGF